METKFCKHCQCEHPLTGGFWYITSNNKKFTCKQKSRQYQLDNRDRILAYQHEYEKEYWQRNRNKKSLSYKAWSASHKEQENARKREWVKNNKEKAEESRRKSSKKRTDKRRAYEIIRKRDIRVRLSTNLRSRLYHALRDNQKAGSAVFDLGCTITELKQYLESKFQDGMSWDNWTINGWHIDHIIPLSRFDLTNREQFLKACHYTNLQPLWAKENLKKGDR